MNPDFHAFVQDFVSYTIDLPDWFKELKLETDCYEAPLPNSPPGSLTPPNVYSKLIEYFKGFYNPDKAVEIWTPRGVNYWIDRKPQIFTKYMSDTPINVNRPIISVFPRGRSRATHRNVPEFVWRETVDKLKEDFFVVLGGTPSGSFLADYPNEDNVLNLISYSGDDKMDKIIEYLTYSVCSVSSQSGLTHVSLLCDRPSHIIGHEKERHCITENRTGVPTSFRYVIDYRAIDSETIVGDIATFLDALIKSGVIVKPGAINRIPFKYIADRKDLVGIEIGVDEGRNALNLLENLDIKKLYLIDPYEEYQQFQHQAEHLETAKEILKPYEDKIVWIKKYSVDAIEDIKEKVDFVYIDGDHSKFSALSDIELYYGVLKDDGLFAGHDYDYDGVKKALQASKVLFGKGLSYAKSLDCPAEDWWLFKGFRLRESFNSLKERKDLVGAEIGVYLADNSLALLRNLDIKKLYLIDPYSDYSGTGVAGVKDDIDLIVSHAEEKLKPYTDKIVWIRKLSSDAISDIEEDLDFVYVDGNHEYDYVKRDIEVYFPVVKSDGVLAGHDFDDERVGRAVTEFCERNALVANSALDNNDNSGVTKEWWVFKNQLHDKILGESSMILAKLVAERVE